jgi:hypothetical protein
MFKIKINMAKSKQKIQIYLYKLKELLDDGFIDKKVYELIYNGRYVKEIDDDAKEPCYKDCMDIYFKWYSIKSGGDIPNISVVQCVKLKSIIKQLRASILNAVRNKGNINPDTQLINLEITNVWKLILSANINKLDLEYCLSNGVEDYKTNRTFWDVDDRSIFYGKMTSIASIENNLDTIKTNIRLRNEQARNIQSKTIGGISVDKLKGTATAVPSRANHLD